MKQLDFSFSDFINNEHNLIFLVGAGCSIDPPSCLPAGRSMIKSILKFCCAENELVRLLKLKDLRFEMLVEIFQDYIDRDLKVIEFYAQCKKPNLQHHFLADMIKKGHIVMTTNFDNLIEIALLESGVRKGEILPVITKKDFKSFNNPKELIKENKKPLFKIHGSFENIITGINTKDSLVATIRSIGRNKEGSNIFQIESFKQELFNNVPENSSLIIMGYSGSDDFDIIPTLKIWKKINKLIWINHTKSYKGKPCFYQFDCSDSKINNNNHVDKVLMDIYQNGFIQQIYRLDCNTSSLIGSLPSLNPNIDKESFSLNPGVWLKENIDIPNNFINYFIPSLIYKNLNEYDESFRCSKKILNLNKFDSINIWRARALNNIGFIYEIRGNFNRALNNYREALKIDNQIQNINDKQSHLNNIASLYEKQGIYQKSLRLFKQALSISISLKDKRGEATYLNNIGMIYNNLGKYQDALKYVNNSLRIRKLFGDLWGEGMCLNNVGIIYKSQGLFPNALSKYETALKIFENLGDLSKKANTIRNIGQIYYANGNYPKALECYIKSLKINKKLQYLPKINLDLNEIGTICYQKKEYSKALIYFKESLEISLKLNLQKDIARAFNNIGAIYKDLNKYDESLKFMKKSVIINKKLGNSNEVALRYNNIGFLYEIQGNHEIALKFYNKALIIDSKIGNIYGIARDKNNIGLIFKRQGKKKRL